MSLIERRLNLKFRTNKALEIMKLFDNFIDPIQLMETKWPLGRVTKELIVGTRWRKDFKEQQTWCVALVSRI